MENGMSAKGGSASGGKICLINNLHKPFNRGGAEKITETLALGLIKAGHEVFLITAKPRYGKYPISPLSPGEKGQANIQYPIYYLNSLYYNLNKLPKFLRLFWHLYDMFNLVSRFKIKKILKREKPDAVITGNLMGLGFLTVRAVKSLKIKLIHIVHDIQLIHPSGLMYYGKEKLIDSWPARDYAGLCARLVDSPGVVIFPSKWLRDLYLKKIFFIKSKRLILPNPVEPALAASGPKANGVFKFLFLGQIEEHKGIFLLINAFNKISAKHRDVELIIVGNGSQADKAGQAAAGNDKIKFLGWPGDKAADKLLNSCQALVYPSLVYENCPNAIQRALVTGLPVLASDLGGIPELLNKNAGLLFKPADLNDLTDKMEWLLNNRNNLENIIQAGKERALFFKTENYIKELEGLLK